jgi:signal transduction histidine kinase
VIETNHSSVSRLHLAINLFMTAVAEPARNIAVGVAKPKILIIDDDFGPRESLRILLKYDFEVMVASSVAEGMAHLREHTFDTIILDNRMPGRSGLEGITDIRGIDENVSIIMLTGYGTLETACEAFRNRATDFMTKPPDTDAMLAAVAKNVALSTAKRARANVSRELAELNVTLTAELAETRPLVKLGQRSDEIIHDLGNPLTILTCCIDLLQTKVDEMRLEDGSQWIEALGYIQMIKKSVQHCCSLSDAWRQLRDDMSESHEVVAASPFLVETIEALQPMAGMAGVELILDCADIDYQVSIEVDVTQMRRVIQNLVVNAVQASEAQRGRVIVEGKTTVGEVLITVTDNGPGIPPERLAIIFEPYFSTKENGTGLGLAISRRIVEEHQGVLSAESSCGRGAVFSIRLPHREGA